MGKLRDRQRRFVVLMLMAGTAVLLYGKVDRLSNDPGVANELYQEILRESG